MRRLLPLLLALVLIVPGLHAWAAAFTSKATGAWNSAGQTTWNEAGVPGAGDTVSIGAGHTITIPVGYTAEVGSTTVYSASGLTIVDTGTVKALVIAGTLLLHCGVQQGDRSVEVQKDSTITFDYGTHTTAIVWTHGQAHNETNSKLVGSTDATAPTSAHPVTIQAAIGQGNVGHCFTSNSHQQCGQWDIQAVKILRMGSSTVPVHRLYNVFTGNTFRLGWAIVDGCGMLFTEDGSFATGCIMSLSNVTIRNSVTSAASGYAFQFLADNPGSAITGTRLFSRLRSDRSLKLWGGQVSLSDVVVDIGTANFYTIDLVNSTSSLTLCDKVVTRSGSTQTRMAIHAGESISNNYNIVAGANNGRWWVMADAGATASKTTAVTSTITQRYGGDNVGDPFIQSTNPSNVQTYQFRNSLWLHNGLDRTQQTASVQSPLGNFTNERYDIEHCTWMSDGSTVETAIRMGESQSADVGNVGFPSIRSNIAWAHTGTSGTQRWVFNQFNGGYVQPTPPLVAAQVDYNGKFNLSSDGLNPVGYHSPTPSALVASGTLGQHDVVGDPKFKDSRLRDIGLWYAVHEGLTITGNEQTCLDGAFTKLMLANDVDGSFDSYYEIAGSATALIPWVTAGYSPTASSYRNADHLGTGAPGAAPWASPVVQRRRPGQGRTGTRTIGTRILAGTGRQA